MRRLRLFAMLLAFAAAQARAEFPEQPVKVIVPFAPGGFVDGFARIFTDRLGAVLGKPVIVENKPGAGGKIGDDAVASAPPDGYTLLIDDVNRPVLATLANPGPPSDDMLHSFAFAGMLGYSPIVLTVAPDLGVKDFAGLIAKMRAEPGRHSFASAGVGTPSHVISAQLVRLFDLNVVHVPYRGGANALTDVAAGTVAWMVNTPNSSLALVEGGRLVPLFVIAPQRLKPLHDVPTLTELGYPEFENEISSMFLMAPAATPKPVLERLNAATNQVQKDKDVVARLAALALSAPPTDISLAAIRALAEKQVAAWTAAVQGEATR
jgi:tripartite-type tricarboxylate transporter receptor subunit TctC